MSSFTSEIKDKLDTVDVIGSYIKLEKAGQNFKARCPFHNEKTPSFFVSPKRGSYYCFGCGAKGDIFSFVQQFEGLDFMGSLKVLAEKAGVKLRYDEQSKEKRDEKARLYDIMDAACGIFESSLRVNTAALEYLRSRGLGDETIKLWRLGFAKDEWHDAETKLGAFGYKREELLACGMIKAGESSKVYDVFRNRIMFPIFDGAGRVIAFSGRIFGTEDKDSAKYLNSPETVLFKKSEILYGFHRAKSGIRRLGFSIVVEGQMDLLMSHQAGFDNTVATSGTALTPEHVALIKRLSPNLVLAYDNDSAGTKATLKAFAMTLSSDLHVKILKISAGKDPADLIKGDKEAWKNAIKEARHIVTYLWEGLVEQKLPKDKFVARWRETVVPVLGAMTTDSERSRLIEQHKMAVFTGIKDEYIMADIHAFAAKTQDNDIVKVNIDNLRPPNNKYGDPARRLFAILFALEDRSINGVDELDLKNKIKNLEGESFGELNEEFKKDRASLVFEAENIYGATIGADEIEELLLNVEEDQLRERLLYKMKEIQKEEGERNEVKVALLLGECQKITARLVEIKAKAEATDKV
ncbi:MAG: DNA primase [Candidatus Taylorbacteria bacterium]|nr:DNA primase [Candidatus Taylorbacteria bacterium]